MSEKTEQEILNHEAELLRAKQTLDIEALRRIYADDLMLTGVLGEPTCSKSAIIEEVRRGIAERESASASGKSLAKTIRIRWSTVADFDLSSLKLTRAGKSAFFVAKQFALQQLL